jgi:hypothetical protein
MIHSCPCGRVASSGDRRNRLFQSSLSAAAAWVERDHAQWVCMVTVVAGKLAQTRTPEQLAILPVLKAVAVAAVVTVVAAVAAAAVAMAALAIAEVVPTRVPLAGELGVAARC